MQWVREGNSDENGPKQRILHHLGHIVSFSLFFHVLMILTAVFLYIEIVIYKVHDRKRDGGADNENGPKRCWMCHLGHW